MTINGCMHSLFPLISWHFYTWLPRRKPLIPNKRAQRALGRSPEKKVKGHSGANNREPQGHNLNNFGREPLDDVIY